MGVILSRLCRDFPETGRDDAEENRCLTHFLFLCRVNAIQALYKKKIKSTSHVDSAQWTEISELVSEMVGKCNSLADEELKRLGKAKSEAIYSSIAEVSREFDFRLLPYLQSNVELMKKLKDYLPEHGPMSAEVMRDIDNESKAIFQNVQPGALVEHLFTFKELLGMFMSEDPKKSGESQSTLGEKTIAVFYATDRLWRDGYHRTKAAGSLDYGAWDVIIPRGHEIGKHDSSTSLKFGGKIDGEWSQSKFLDEIEGQRAENSDSATDVPSSNTGPPKSKQEVFLYIHGYNTSFKSAIRHAAQLKHHLQFGGQVILYSWPSKGKWWAYGRDEGVIQKTATLLQNFITTIRDSFSKVHILAHSMGNRALIEALTEQPLVDNKEDREKLKNVILAAADEELSKFEHMLDRTNDGDSVPLISVYSSITDRPLLVSAWWHGRQRLGNTKSFFVKHSMRERDRRVDVIDATGVTTGVFKGHSYHVKAPKVVRDIQNLLTGPHPPRAGNRPITKFKHDLVSENEWFFHALDESRWCTYIEKNPKSGVSRTQNKPSSTRVRDGCEQLNNLREIS